MLITMVPVCMAKDRDRGDKDRGDRDFGSFHNRDQWRPPSWIYGSGYSNYDMYPSYYRWYYPYYSYQYYPYYGFSYYWYPYRYWYWY